MNRLAIRTAILMAAALVVRAAGAAAEGPDTPTSGPLYAKVAELDAKLFDAVFMHCDADKVAALVADDFEFYHDQWGQIARSKDQFVSIIRGQCERQAQGTDYHARRELVPDSLRVYPLKGYGAVETGTHRFYRLDKGGPAGQLTETAEFFQLWKEDHGSWKLARVISYDHQAPAQ